MKVPYPPLDQREALEMAVCLAQYAPAVIEGEVVKEDPKTVHVNDVRGNVWIFQKNAENYKFWDITDKVSAMSPDLERHLEESFKHNDSVLKRLSQM